jgi:PIN domain nuclease of toxin-antitoxin system
MRLLLDTHTFLWFIAGDGRLSRQARDLIDRMIIAQGLVERLPVVGRDPAFDHYGIQRLW